MQTSSPRRTRRLSLAPTQAKVTSSTTDEEGTSLLMDMSLADLQKSTPAKGKMAALADSDLDRLSQEELETLAWQAMAEEQRLKERVRGSAKSGSNDATAKEDPMKNVTVRRKSNSPRKVQETEHMPLPKVDSGSMPVRHTYDRQASPTRSALRRPYTRKSVAFGAVAEYEISREGHEVEAEMAAQTSSDKAAHADTLSSVEASSETRSSSPLARFNTGGKLLPAVKTAIQSTKGPALTRRTSLRSAAACSGKDEKQEGGKASTIRKTTSSLSQSSPVARTRVREAVQESAVKARAKARDSALKAKAKAKALAVTQVPSGFRLSSSGTLVAQTKSNPFTAASASLPSRSTRRRSSLTNKGAQGGNVSAATSKVNPVPAWMKKRKDALEREEEERLQREIERVRAQELGAGQDGASTQKKTTGRTTSTRTSRPAYNSAVEKRIAERAVWEAKRKAKEDLLNEAKEQARNERLEREEEAYRQARQKSVVRANPVPEWIRTRSTK